MFPPLLLVLVDIFNYKATSEISASTPIHCRWMGFCLWCFPETALLLWIIHRNNCQLCLYGTISSEENSLQCVLLFLGIKMAPLLHCIRANAENSESVISKCVNKKQTTKLSAR